MNTTPHTTYAIQPPTFASQCVHFPYELLLRLCLCPIPPDNKGPRSIKTEQHLGGGVSVVCRLPREEAYRRAGAALVAQAESTLPDEDDARGVNLPQLLRSILDNPRDAALQNRMSEAIFWIVQGLSAAHLEQPQKFPNMGVLQQLLLRELEHPTPD